MSGKKKIYKALVDGATKGLVDDALFAHIVEECPKASSKKIVRAALLALSDHELNDANILHVIYALAIRHRLDPVTENDMDDGKDDNDDEKENPAVIEVEKPKKAKKAKKEAEVEQPAS